MRSVGDHASKEREIDAPVCPEFSNESVTGPSRTTERSVMSPEQIEASLCQGARRVDVGARALGP